MLRRRFLALVPAAALFGAALALGAGPAATHDAHRKGAAPSPLAMDKLFGGPFSLTDHDGVRRTDADYRGKYMLMFFGYTSCPAICPTDLQHMATALDLLGADAARVQPLFITVDPARDTPDVLKDYVANFGPRFVGLTGSEADIRKVARTYRIHRRKVVMDDMEAHGEGHGGHHVDYLVDHATLTFLMGPDGKFLTLFPHDTDGAVMAERLRTYLAAPQS
jgi:protein SCO1/2